LAIAAANESVVLNAWLKDVFEAIAVAFGFLSVLTGILFIFEQLWARLRR